MDYQTIIENFFSMLGRFDFDRAKSYIDTRKEVLQKLAPTFPNQLQLMSMLTTFSHLAEVEKTYHNQPFPAQPHHHSFLPTTGFLRKAKGLKDMYNDIFIELQQLEQMDGNVKQSKQQRENHLTSNRSSFDSTSTASNIISYHVTGLPNQLTLSKHQSIDNTTIDQNSSTSSSATGGGVNGNGFDSRDLHYSQVPQSPSSAFRNSFFRVLSPISSSASIPSQNQNLRNHLTQNGLTISTNSAIYDPYLLSSSSGYEPPPNSSNTTPTIHSHNSLNIKEFSEELISHFCRQLQNFIQARQDMIDVYEKLTEASNKKFTSVDSIAYRLSMLCRQYHKYFHHPLLAPIKEGMTLECESLMTLIKATIDLQHWRFLPTLYDLQEAQSKLNYWASNTFNKEASRRRFKVSKTQTAPRLYEWLCKFKEFLISKFTLYFHATLSKNYPIGIFKSTCSRLTIDYYGKLSSFQRKIDALFVALLYDVSNEKDFRGLGYSFPSKDYQQPQGKNTLQPMVVIPGEGRAKLNNLQAEIYMIVVTNQQIVMKDGYYQFHDNIKKLTYSITKPDLNVVLVIVWEGQKSDRDSHLRSSALELTNQFALVNIFTF